MDNNDNDSSILKLLKKSQGKKIKLILSNGLVFITDDLVLLNNSEICFHDLKRDKVTCNVSMVQMVTEVMR